MRVYINSLIFLFTQQISPSLTLSLPHALSVLLSFPSLTATKLRLASLAADLSQPTKNVPCTVRSLPPPSTSPENAHVTGILKKKAKTFPSLFLPRPISDRHKVGTVGFVLMRGWKPDSFHRPTPPKTSPPSYATQCRHRPPSPTGIRQPTPELIEGF